MDELDSLDIELRDPDDVGCRIALLATLVVWPEHQNRSDRESWLLWLEHQGIAAIATKTETNLLIAHIGSELNEHELELCGRAFDALLPLTWSIALTDSFSLTLEEPNTRDLFEGLPMPPENIEPFLDQLVMRDENVIATERERAEVWNWRLAAEIAYRSSGPRDRQETEEAIREVVLECSTSFVIEQTDGMDFLIDGVQVRNLDSEQLETVLVASEEHLRALNWICGLTEWDAIHIPD